MKNLICYFMLISIMIGCPSKEGATPSSQVVVKVNDDEITVNQINAELQHIHGGITNTQTDIKRVFDVLVDRRLSMPEVIKLNIDRTPKVQHLVDAACAQAYLTRQISSIKPASGAYINQFIEVPPALFSQRKILETTDVVFANKPDMADYQKLQANGILPEKLKPRLETNHIAYEVAATKIFSESLTPQVLSMLAQVKEGDLLFIRDDLKVILRSVKSIVESSLSQLESLVVTLKNVNNNHHEQFIQKESIRLRKLSKVDYLNYSLNLESHSNDIPNTAPGNRTHRQLHHLMS